VLNFLRGDKTHERGSTASGSARAYRERPALLGDIGQFRARPVGRPDAPYSNSSNPGYAAFKSTWANRPTVVYVGTNAGVIHAVHGSLTGPLAGRELFAYVPGALYTGPSGTPALNGLQALANPNYDHRNYVDATPVVADVDFGRTQGNNGAPDWRTLLVGGLGKGGKAVYALDITNPMGVTSEADAAARVLWEFTDPDLGFVYGEPAVVKTRKHGWVVIVASGYNNSDGNGYLFFLNPRTGALLDKVSTGVGSPGQQAGLAHVQPFLLDRTNGTADAVYAGDLLGNLWRLDLTVNTGSLPAPLLMAELRDGTQTPLPVTSRPLVIIHPESGRRYVTVGTGRLLDASDKSSSQGQRFFAFIDGDASMPFNRSGADLPGTLSWPFRTQHLRPVTNLTQPITLDLTREIGWYLDLGQAAGVGWRVISDATSFFGTVAFATMQPGGSVNPCEPGGNNRVYAIDLGDGRSRLTGVAQPSASTPLVPFLSVLPGVVTDLNFFSVSGQARLIGGSDSGDASVLHGNWTSTGQVRRMNWREVILAD
jgi:type IV pilus assembly protein PilY1